MADFYGEAKKFPQFNKQEIEKFIASFKEFDMNGDGHIDANELQQILTNSGEKVTKIQVQQQISEVDTDKSGTIEWDEFLQVIVNLRAGKTSAFGQTLANKTNVFEQAIKDAAPKVPKKSWKATTNSGGHANVGKYKAGIAFDKAPPEKKSINDLP